MPADHPFFHPPASAGRTETINRVDDDGYRRRCGEAVGEILAVTKAVAVVVEMDDARGRVTYVMHWPGGKRDRVQATYDAIEGALSFLTAIRTTVLAAIPREMRR